MKNNKIIIIFIAIILAMFSGNFLYNHQQKVSLAQYYYDIGDYQKAVNLDVGNISKKAQEAEKAKTQFKEYLDKTLKN